MVSNQTQQIKRVLKILGEDFALSHNPNTRKGGLIGLAATAIALSKVKIQDQGVRKENGDGGVWVYL